MWMPVGPWVALTPGSWVRASTGRFDGLALNARIDCHSILFQQCPGNTDIFYISDSIRVGTIGTGTGSSGIVAAPTYNSSGKAIILPSAQVSLPMAGDAFNAANYWIYSDTAGYVAVSILIW